MDYTIIVQVRHQFGDDDLNIGVFAGSQQTFNFNCPNIAANQPAVLMLQGHRVGREQTIEINGSAISGGLPPGPGVFGSTTPGGAGASDFHTHGFSGVSMGWSGYVLFVGANVLTASNNNLRVASRQSSEFVIDNVVLFYKTRDS